MSIDFLILMRTSERGSEKRQRRSKFSNPHITPNTGSVNGKAIAAEMGWITGPVVDSEVIAYIDISDFL